MATQLRSKCTKLLDKSCYTVYTRGCEHNHTYALVCVRVNACVNNKHVRMQCVPDVWQFIEGPDTSRNLIHSRSRNLEILVFTDPIFCEFSTQGVSVNSFYTSFLHWRLAILRAVPGPQVSQVKKP